MKEIKHTGVYGIIIKEEKILLINKVSGPYHNKLDLPGGTIEFGEKPEETLKRELLEETGIKITSYELFDANSVTFNWKYKEELLNWQHIGIFYKILDYNNDIKEHIEIDKLNDDSLGAKFYNINTLTKEELSKIAILELEKMGYILN